MRAMRFGARVAAGPRGGGIITVPFDPDETWGAKAEHHVNGTVNGCRVRVTIAPGDGGWAFPLSPSRMRDTGFAVGSEVMCELAPEGPQRGDLPDDIATALAASPAAGAFFDTLAQFYRKAYLRYIDATTRRPDLRAARIAEVTDLLANGVKERPRSLRPSPNPYHGTRPVVKVSEREGAPGTLVVMTEYACSPSP
jgi:hypothetical protein